MMIRISNDYFLAKHQKINNLIEKELLYCAVDITLLNVRHCAFVKMSNLHGVSEDITTLRPELHECEIFF